MHKKNGQVLSLSVQAIHSGRLINLSECAENLAFQGGDG